MRNLLSDIIDRSGVARDEIQLFSRQVLQKIVLNGLSRGQFFKRAAFHGGTALRILHSLDRYSEDLDFVLFDRDPGFSLERYMGYVESEIRSYGLSVSSKVRDSRTTATSSGDVRCRTRGMILEIGFPEGLVESINPDAVMRVKIDVDTDPPSGAGYQKYSMTDPLNYYLCALDLPSLFAGKVSAVLTRRWGMREKGRDFYDFLWYIDRSVPVNMSYLRSNLERAGAIGQDDRFDLEVLKGMLRERFSSVDYASAMSDVGQFVIGRRPPSDWCPELFIRASESLTSSSLRA